MRFLTKNEKLSLLTIHWLLIFTGYRLFMFALLSPWTFYTLRAPCFHTLFAENLKTLDLKLRMKALRQLSSFPTDHFCFSVSQHPLSLSSYKPGKEQLICRFIDLREEKAINQDYSHVTQSCSCLSFLHDRISVVIM